MSKQWTLKAITEQAVVLYEGERAKAARVPGAAMLQAENFWRSHRDTAFHALGNDLSSSVAITLDARIAAFVEEYSARPGGPETVDDAGEG